MCLQVTATFVNCVNLALVLTPLGSGHGHAITTNVQLEGRRGTRGVDDSVATRILTWLQHRAIELDE